MMNDRLSKLIARHGNVLLAIGFIFGGAAAATPPAPAIQVNPLIGSRKWQHLSRRQLAVRDVAVEPRKHQGQA